MEIEMVINGYCIDLLSKDKAFIYQEIDTKVSMRIGSTDSGCGIYCIDNIKDHKLSTDSIYSTTNVNLFTLDNALIERLVAGAKCYHSYYISCALLNSKIALTIKPLISTPVLIEDWTNEFRTCKNLMHFRERILRKYLVFSLKLTKLPSCHLYYMIHNNTGIGPAGVDNIDNLYNFLSKEY